MFYSVDILRTSNLEDSITANSEPLPPDKTHVAQPHLVWDITMPRLCSVVWQLLGLHLKESWSLPFAAHHPILQSVS